MWYMVTNGTVGTVTYLSIYLHTYLYICTAIPRLTSDPANEFFG